MKFDAARRFFPVVVLSLAAIACGGAAAPPPPLTSVAPVAASAPHFSYADAEGPEHWGDLDPTFALCKSGAKQSPINLPVVLRTDSSIAITPPSYAPIPLVVLNNGHTIQVKNTVAASITLDGVKYDLAQFHFHSPSEHTIGGKSFEMEMHLVHKSADGKTLVVALMFTKGAENKTLKPIWDSLPTDISETPTTVPNASLDIASLFPAEIKFEHYEGSLTVPPCTEQVGWFVVERPARGGLEMSGDQIAHYRAIMHGPTNRPVQPLGRRTVVEVSAAH